MFALGLVFRLTVQAAGVSAGCRIDPLAGTWIETFDTTACLAVAQHLSPAASGGMTISPAIQSWSLPASARFSGGTAGGTVVFPGRGSLGESVSLWSSVGAPGQGVAYASTCVPVTPAPCPLDASVKGAPDGVLLADNPSTVTIEGLTGFPYAGPGGIVNGVGWDTKPSGVPMCTTASPPGTLGGIMPFGTKPIATAENHQALDAGSPYAATFVVSADHASKAVPYVSFELFNRATNLTVPGASWTANETDLALPWSTNFTGMTPCTIVLNASPAGADLQPRAVSLATNGYCTVLGPVYFTAQQGAWDSPVLDSLSPATVWQTLSWDLDQNNGAADPTCACGPGSPLTPIELYWEIGAVAPVHAGQPVGAPQPSVGTMTIPISGAGRYLRLGAVLHGRETAAAVVQVPSLAPGDPHKHFSGWRPAIKGLTVTYFARAALAESRPLAPGSLKTWGTVTFAADMPGNSTVAVDVLDGAGNLLYANVPSGFMLDPAVNPFLYPSLRLRARLDADSAAPGNRPVLTRWEVTWTPLPERLTLNRNTIRPAAGESVAGLVAVELGGRIRVEVHDASGQMVRSLINTLVDAQATPFTWDGRNARGELVVPGVYYVTASTPKGAGTRKIAVVR